MHRHHNILQTTDILTHFIDKKDDDNNKIVVASRPPPQIQTLNHQLDRQKTITTDDKHYIIGSMDRAEQSSVWPELKS